MTQNQEGNTGASGSNEPVTPTTPPVTEPASELVAPEAKIEVKDGKVLVDGKSFVAESDLIAAKKSLEGQIEKQQATHDAAVDAAKLETSSAQTQIAQLNAQIKTNEEARKSGAVSDEEAARVKTELDTAKVAVETANTRILELRRANIIIGSGGAVTAEQLEGKTLVELDSFEEALKVLTNTRGGPGAYAVGGGQGAAAPESPMDRAGRILQSTPMRGTRNAETQ